MRASEQSTSFSYLFIFERSFLLAFGLLFQHHKVLGFTLLLIRRAGKWIQPLRLPGWLLSNGSTLLQ